jgi:AcrR family transcriptional regulator
MDALPAHEQALPRQRLSADDRRLAIIAAARTLFARNGFHGTGTSEIAAAAGCSEPVIYKHFASKHALFAAVLEDSTRIMRDKFDAAADGEGGLFDGYLRFVRGLAGDSRVAELSRLRYLALTLTADPAIRASLAAMVAQWQAGVRAAIEDGRANGRIREDVDVESVAMLFFGLAQAAGFMSAIEGEGALACFPRHFDALVDLLTPQQGGATWPKS